MTEKSKQVLLLLADKPMWEREELVERCKGIYSTELELMKRIKIYWADGIIDIIQNPRNRVIKQVKLSDAGYDYVMTVLMQKETKKTPVDTNPCGVKMKICYHAHKCHLSHKCDAARAI